MAESDFPSNSKYKKESGSEPKEKTEKKIERVTTGQAIQRKKSLGKRFRDTFISGADSKSVIEYVTFDILIPAAKAMVVDATQAGLERKFYGESRSLGHRGYGRSGPIAYNRMGSSSRSFRDDVLGRDDPRMPQMSRRGRATHDFGEIVLESRVEAAAALDGLAEALVRFDQATVADLYDLVGMDSNYTDQRWGWEDLHGAEIVRVRDGYLLNLPRTISLD